MKRYVSKAFVLASGVIAIMLITGCEEQQQIPSTKKARLIAAENIQLKKELQQRDSEIEGLKKQYDNELKTQKELLSKCRRERKSLEEQLEGKFEGQLNNLIKGVGEECAKLREENEKLKAQIEQLKAEVKEHEEKAAVKLRPLEQP